MYPDANKENPITAPALHASNLNLIVHIPRNELNTTLNYIVNNLFSEGLTIDDGYHIHTTISGLIDMQALNNQIFTSLPLQIEVNPEGFFESAKVKGNILVSFSTSLEIFQDELLNKTELTSYKWITKPTVNILGLNLPIEPIVNVFIKKYKSLICQTIDESIRKNFDLKTIKAAGREFFNQPMYSTQDSIIHLFANPIELAIGPMSMTFTELQIPVSFSFESVIAETKPQDLFMNPTFSVRPFYDTISSFSIQSRLPLPYIEQIVREQTENQKYGSGLSSITIHKINMQGEGRTLVIQMEVTGAYDGNMIMRFDPSYDKFNRKVFLENFHLQTKGGLKPKKIIFSLLKSFAVNKIKGIIEDQINSNLQDYLNNVKKMLSGTEIIKGTYLTGDLLDYEIKDIRCLNSRLYFNLHSSLKMNADVRHIDLSKLIIKRP